MTLEISEGGMSVMTRASLSVGKPVEIELVAQCKLAGVVRHQHGTIFGLEFLHMNGETTARIREICKKLPLFDGRALNI